MRQYTVVFMEQRIGVAHLRPVEGEQGIASFAAVDDETALAYIKLHLLERLKNCTRAELSSLHVVEGAAGGIRLVDDTHANPRFQDAYVKYDAVTKEVEMDWASTRTALIAEHPLR